MKVRKATKKDWKNYFHLKKEEEKYYNCLLKKKTKISEKEYAKEFQSTLKSKKEILLVAKENNDILGLVHGKFKKSKYLTEGFIQELFVPKRYRNRGIATTLIKKFETLVKKKKLGRLSLSVIRINKPAVKLYRKLGFDLYRYYFKKELNLMNS